MEAVPEPLVTGDRGAAATGVGRLARKAGREAPIAIGGRTCTAWGQVGEREDRAQQDEAEAIAEPGDEEEEHDDDDDEEDDDDDDEDDGPFVDNFAVHVFAEATVIVE